MPYLDRSDIFNKYGPVGEAPNSMPVEHLKILVCPDDAESINHGTNATYVVNAGQNADDGGPNEKAAGVFTYQVKAAADSPVNVVNSGNIADGLATTFMLGENIDAGEWTQSIEGCVGMNWGSGLKMNAQTGTGGTPCTGSLSRPSSFHAGGVVFTFCDGHTQFVSEDIAPAVFDALMTPRGREAFGQGPIVENSY